MMSNKILIALLAAGVVTLAGCESAPMKSAEGGKPELSVEAKEALAKAEADVKAADAKKALWTTAENALKAAKAAAGKGDSATVIKDSKTASEQANLGMEQKAYPVMTPENVLKM
jgi:flagellar basal body L-ring protein FlgH